MGNRAIEKLINETYGLIEYYYTIKLAAIDKESFKQMLSTLFDDEDPHKANIDFSILLPIPKDYYGEWEIVDGKVNITTQNKDSLLFKPIKEINIEEVLPYRGHGLSVNQRHANDILTEVRMLDTNAKTLADILLNIHNLTNEYNRGFYLKAIELITRNVHAEYCVDIYGYEDIRSFKLEHWGTLQNGVSFDKINVIKLDETSINFGMYTESIFMMKYFTNFLNKFKDKIKVFDVDIDACNLDVHERYCVIKNEDEDDSYKFIANSANPIMNVKRIKGDD